MSSTELTDASVTVVTRRSAAGEELFITAGRTSAAPVDLFAAIAETLNRHGAKIFMERIFTAPGAAEGLKPLRRAAYDTLDDGVEPAWLTDQSAGDDRLIGIQVHAIVAPSGPETLVTGGAAVGRSIDLAGGKLIGATGLMPAATGAPARQAQEMLDKAQGLLAAAGADFSHVARTWMWLRDVLDWYGDFNRVRNEFFVRRGLLGADASGRLPASTGIGIAPADGMICSMDLCAIVGSEIEYLLAAGNQGAASSYGSAFSRAAAIATPGGKTVFVSGTASIDAEGNTTHLDESAPQITDTIANVLAVLRDAGCREQDIVQSIIYCKTPQVAEIFCEEWGELPWPQVVTITDVCRDNLLFEIEATAVRGN